MANTYVTGDKTKEKILKEAKKLLYKNGFTKTTYDSISYAASINRALIPYHFKNKQILGQTIYNETVNSFITHFDSILDISEYSPDFVSILHIVAYYRLLNNKNFSRFVNELQADTSFSAYMDRSERTLMEGLIGKGSKLSKSEIDILVTSEIGMKKELIRMVNERDAKMDLNEAAKIQLFMLLSYAGYSRKKIDELYDSAAQVVDMLSFTITSSFDVKISFK